MIRRCVLREEKVFLRNFCRKFSDSKLYPEHIVTTPVQKVLLAVGSSAIALVDPFRHDMVAVSGETLGQGAVTKMWEKMSHSEEGSRILSDKPRINSMEVDLKRLESLPENTLGYQYIKFLSDNNITCDTRRDVRFIDDAELAYVMQRYREIHDLVHLLVGMPTDMLGEVVVKWIEAIQCNLAMCWGAAVFGAYRLRPKQRRRYMQTHLDWAIQCGQQSHFFMNKYYEKRWEQDIEDLRREMNIPLKPNQTRK